MAMEGVILGIKGIEDGEGMETERHPATAKSAVAVLGRVRRRCSHPKTKQGCGRCLARAELKPRPTSK